MGLLFVAVAALLVLGSSPSFGVNAAPLILVSLHNSVGSCDGPVETTQVDEYTDPGCGLSGAYNHLIVGGQDVPNAVYSGLNCGTKTFSYGDTSCSNTVPMGSVCTINPINSKGMTVQCLPDICKPESSVSKKGCLARAATCGPWGKRLKW
jgi:hypothetical protein